jgi:hypothetical protein
VSCVTDLTKAQGEVPNFFRSVGLKNCTRAFLGSMDPVGDQSRWDSWLSDWKTSFMYASAALVLETVWDAMEFLMYICI